MSWLVRLGKLTGGTVAVGAAAAGATVVSRGDDAGFLRFGRAALTGVNVIIDYKRTMGTLPAEANDEYRIIMSKVGKIRENECFGM